MTIPLPPPSSPRMEFSEEFFADHERAVRRMIRLRDAKKAAAIKQQKPPVPIGIKSPSRKNKKRIIDADGFQIPAKHLIVKNDNRCPPLLCLLLP
ncbi:hypothetical protein NPIL_256891 [Nephila pilipes]|uniref:Uncharacterized protein n=1 Tax=Nephila pilipes TaxID=299642 RepID=A0A8X6NHE3_NEPPI|nr:hypothetical protein NPIL_256891 [Nephila pilipes]